MKPMISRREMMAGGVAAGALALSWVDLAAFGLENPKQGDELLPFLDPQPINPKKPMLAWDKLQDWMTPADQFFDVSHYGKPTVEVDQWRLQIEGLVDKPISLSLDEIKDRPKHEFIATLECSGNGVSPSFMGAIGNARWTGTPLGPLLKECGLKPDGARSLFWAADEGKEKIRDHEYQQNFARSLSIKDALRDEVLLAYAMNGEPLSAATVFRCGWWCPAGTGLRGSSG